MWYLWVLLILSYGGLTWRSLLEASSPIIPCQPALHDCFHPSVKIGDNITLQLELYQPQDTTSKEQTSNGNFQWFPINTCRVNVTIPQTGKLPELLTTTTTNKSINENNNVSAAAAAAASPSTAATIQIQTQTQTLRLIYVTFLYHPLLGIDHHLRNQ